MANENGWGDGSVNNSIGWGQGANNNIGWGKSHLSSWSGLTDIDGGNLPVNSVAPAITGTAQEGQTLTCSTGTWSGSPTYTYQWKRNGNNIGGATSSTYLLVTADVGQSIICTVTATNFVGSAAANSNTVIPVSAFSFLLDTYSGATAAYSLRKLRSAYTDNCIRVRRSSDNTEQNIGFVSNVLDTASLLSFCGAGNGFVTTWYDQSGNSYDVSQPILLYQPQIVSSGSVINVNSKPALSFDGTDDSLLNTLLSQSSTKSAFYVKKGASLNGNSNVFGFPVGANQFGIYYWNSSPFSYGFNTWSADSWGYNSADTEFLSQTLEMALFLTGNPSTSGVKLFINNTQKTLSQVRGTSNSVSMTDGLRIGEGGQLSGNQNYDGWQQELVIWSADYSSTNRIGIQNNINTYYGIY